MNRKLILTLVTLGLASAANTFAAGTVVVESRAADSSLNSNAWTEVSGVWGKSKNKTKVDDATIFTSKSVSICATNVPAPAFKVAPEGLESGKSYQVDVTFGTSKGNQASADLVVAVAVTGVSASTLPTNTPAFQGSNANSWTTLGTITPSTGHPTLTFTYKSGTLSPNPAGMPTPSGSCPLMPPNQRRRKSRRRNPKGARVARRRSCPRQWMFSIRWRFYLYRRSGSQKRIEFPAGCANIRPRCEHFPCSFWSFTGMTNMNAPISFHHNRLLLPPSPGFGAPGAAGAPGIAESSDDDRECRLWIFLPSCC